MGLTADRTAKISSTLCSVRKRL